MYVRKQQTENTAPCREGSALHQGPYGKKEGDLSWESQTGTRHYYDWQEVSTGKKSLEGTLGRTSRPFRLSWTSNRKLWASRSGWYHWREASTNSGSVCFPQVLYLSWDGWGRRAGALVGLRQSERACLTCESVAFRLWLRNYIRWNPKWRYGRGFFAHFLLP